MTSQQYRRDIDGLRAIAVLTVVLFHADVTLFSGGFVGVDVFFVISGFLITGIIKADVEKNRFSFGRFYIRRVRRLFPALFAVVAASFVAAFLLFSAEHFERFAGALIYALTSLSNIYFWAEAGYFDTDASFKPLLHTWSLSVEEQFYMIWPGLLLLLLTWLNRFLVLGVIIALGVGSLVWAEAMLAQDIEAAFFLTPFRIAEFAVGALMVWIVPLQPRNRLWLEPLLALGLVLILVPVFLYSKETPFPGLTAMVPCIGTALALYAGRAPFMGRLLSNPVMVGIGLVSYSYYLIHWPLIVFYKYYTFDLLDPLDQVGLVVGGLVLAILSYKFIEQPFRVPNPNRPQWTPPAMGLSAAMLVIVLIIPATSIWATGGWEWRVTTRSVPTELDHTVVARRSAQDRALSKVITGSRVVTVGSKRRNARKALIIGDSHARQLTPFADYLGQKHNLRFQVFDFPGCPPVFGTYKLYDADNQTRFAERQQLCKQMVGDWESLVKEGEYDVVFIASRWAWLYEPTEYGPFKIRRDMLVDAEVPVPTIEQSRKVFASGLRRTIETISETGAQTVVVSQVPNQGKNLDGCDAVPVWIFSEANLQRRCRGIDGATALERLAFTDATIAALADLPKVSVLIPSQHLCEGTDCRAWADGTTLYRDSNHLNRFGAVYLARAWEASPDFPFN